MRQLFRELYAELTPFGKFWFNLGGLSLMAACAMSFFFGKSISMTHGVFLVVLSAVAAFGPHAAHKVFNQGNKGAGIALAIICAPLLMIEFYSHAGYTAGLRGVDIGNARIQQAKHSIAHEAVDEDKSALATAIKARDQLKLAHPWAATTTASALRAELPAIEEAIAQEAARVRCGPKCLALKERKAAIESRIAIAEENNGIAIRIAELEKRIEGRRTVATTTEFKHSSAAHQNEFLAKLVALVGTGSLSPSEFQNESAQQSVNLAMAIAGTGLPALCFFVAGCFARRPEDFTPGAVASSPEPTPYRPLATQRRKWKDIYDAQCNTMGIAPVAA